MKGSGADNFMDNLASMGNLLSAAMDERDYDKRMEFLNQAAVID